MRMGRIYPAIDDRLRDWIGRQALFFVGTAPRADDGHVNVSPKGPIGTLAVLDDHTVAYLDVVGSGAETIAHVRENGRIVIMLCAFEGPPRIVRLHGRGASSSRTTRVRRTARARWLRAAVRPGRGARSSWPTSSASPTPAATACR